MKRITRQNVKVDRVACPWFVDCEAEFIFVPAEPVASEAERYAYCREAVRRGKADGPAQG